MIRLAPIVKQHLIFNEQPIRRAIKERYVANLIVEELKVDSGKARIDMVVLGQCLHGIELKSDGDTLNRLHYQMHFYSSAFEQLTVVTGYSHLYEVLEMVPWWWGIQVAEQTDAGEVFFEQIRENKDNPELSQRSVLGLLTWHEIYELSLIANLKALKSASLNRLIDNVVNHLELEEIVRHAQFALAKRAQQSFAFATPLK